MVYEGENKVLKNSYIEAASKATVYSNVITGVPIFSAVSIRYRDYNENKILPCTVSHYLTYKEYRYLNKLKDKFLLLPCFKDDNEFTKRLNNSSNINIESSVWKSIKSIKAATLRCIGCGTIHIRERVDCPVCNVCGSAYNIKASKMYEKNYKKIIPINLYSQEVISRGDCKCLIVSVDKVVKKYNELRGYENE